MYFFVYFAASYISKCCVTDPDAERCYLSQAKLIIPLILRGKFCIL